MPTLHLGVMDIPYANNEKRKIGRGKKKKLKSTTSMTTGDVADILEDKYHIMELFFEEHEEMILGNLTEALAGALESAAMGAPVTENLYAAATQGIDEAFKTFITSQRIESLGIPGTPTKAALRGVSHRKAHPYAKGNARRPSFIDTGLYVDSFVSWVD